MNINKKTIIEEVFLYSILIFVSVWLLQGKNNFHVDETFSYGLANHLYGIEMLKPKDGEYFEPAEKAYYGYLTVTEDRFNYKNVWTNQEMDVHPPIYYAILHTICSLFMDNFTIWYAGVINIAAVCFTLYYLRKILSLLEIGKIGKITISLVFIFSTGIGSAICFLRMYALAMFWVTLTAYLFINSLKNNTLEIREFIKIFLVAVCGSLTHYYYLIYLFFLCAVYCVYLVFCNRKKIVAYLITFIVAGITATSIFPAMTFHMFEDYRGEESIDNLNAFSIEGFMERFNKMKEMVDRQVFAGYFVWILLAIVLMLVFSIVHKTMNHVSCDTWIWCIIVIPLLCYFALVSQIAVYLDSRYMIPIYAMLIVAVYGGVCKVITNIDKTYISNGIIGIVGFIVIVTMIKQNAYDYRKLPDIWSEHFNKHAAMDSIYIHDDSWSKQMVFTGIRNYGSVRFFTEEYFLESLEQDERTEELVVVIDNGCEIDKVLQKMTNCYPNLKLVEYFEELTYAQTYLFAE